MRPITAQRHRELCPTASAPASDGTSPVFAVWESKTETRKERTWRGRSGAEHLWAGVHVHGEVQIRDRLPHSSAERARLKLVQPDRQCWLRRRLSLRLPRRRPVRHPRKRRQPGCRHLRQYRSARVDVDAQSPAAASIPSSAQGTGKIESGSPLHFHSGGEHRLVASFRSFCAFWARCAADGPTSSHRGRPAGDPSPEKDRRKGQNTVSQFCPPDSVSD